MTDSVNTREIVLDLLMEVTKNGRPSHVVHHEMLTKYQYLEKQERSFLSRLFKGSLEMLLQLDYVLDQFSSVKTSKMKPVIRNILRMSVYQILFMDHVPDSAACNEAVKLAGKRGFKSLKGFVNGVLRSISRNVAAIVWPNEAKEPVKYLSVMYSVPEWMVQLWLNTYDYETVKAMVSDGVKEHPVTIRCLDEAGVEALKALLEREGVTVEAGSLLPYALKISGFNYLGELQSFCEGRYTVQDESSMMVVEKAGICPGDRIIDVCAAPGGKSLHAAGRLKALEAGENVAPGHVFSRDLTEEKVRLIEENLERLGLDNVTPQVRDATVTQAADRKSAQVVLCDLPCSGLGVLGRKADIKYRMSLEQLGALAKLQRQILSAVHDYVVPGGVLVYSTCTVNPGENMENARWFEENFGFHMTYSRQFLQGVDGCDGFFIACFKRSLE